MRLNERYGLGGTLVCYEALRNGEVDLYPEYSGTLGRAILKVSDASPSTERLNQLLDESPLEVLDSFGFNNTYAIALKDSLAKRLKLERVSQLSEQTELRVAFGLEFLNREDGWPGLSALYGLTQNPTGIEHGLAYQAIDDGKIDITDAYSTDGDLRRYKLTTLIDDRQYFPQYIGMPFVRKELPQEVKAVVNQLAGKIDDQLMRDLNASVVIDGKSFAEVASQFLVESKITTRDVAAHYGWQRSHGFNPGVIARKYTRSSETHIDCSRLGLPCRISPWHIGLQVCDTLPHRCLRSRPDADCSLYRLVSADDTFVWYRSGSCCHRLVPLFAVTYFTEYDYGIAYNRSVAQKHS